MADSFTLDQNLGEVAIVDAIARAHDTPSGKPPADPVCAPFDPGIRTS